MDDTKILTWYNADVKPPANISVLLWIGIPVPGIWDGKDWILNRFITGERNWGWVYEYNIMARIGVTQPSFWAYYNAPQQGE